MNEFQSKIFNYLDDPSTNLIFLHGFLGSGKEWHSIAEMLNKKLKCNIYTPDLPYHGNCINWQHEYSFSNVYEYFHSLIENKNVILWGYSLGGRIAMKLLEQEIKTAQKNIKALIIESSNYGLANQEARQQRYNNDCIWADRFKNEDLEKVLADWYEQKVFIDLTPKQKKTLIKEKKINNSLALSKSLRNFSLGLQNDLSSIFSSQIPICYLYGSKDEKFKKIAQSIQKHYSSVIVNECQNCGHNIHAFQPRIISQILTKE